MYARLSVSSICGPLSPPSPCPELPIARRNSPPSLNDSNLSITLAAMSATITRWRLSMATPVGRVTPSAMTPRNLLPFSALSNTSTRPPPESATKTRPASSTAIPDGLAKRPSALTPEPNEPSYSNRAACATAGTASASATRTRMYESRRRMRKPTARARAGCGRPERLVIPLLRPAAAEAGDREARHEAENGAHHDRHDQRRTGGGEDPVDRHVLRVQDREQHHEDAGRHGDHRADLLLAGPCPSLRLGHGLSAPSSHGWFG